MTVEVEIRFQDILDLCDKIECDMEFGIDVDLSELNEMIVSYFPSVDSNLYFNEKEASEVALRVQKIEKLIAQNREFELERNLEEIESLKKYQKYMDVLDMVEEKKWK